MLRKLLVVACLVLFSAIPSSERAEAQAVVSQTKNFQFWNSISATPVDFRLNAGLYGVTLHATAWGTATLRMLMPDGTLATYLTVQAFTADSYTDFRLPAGQYQLTLSGVTGLTGEIALVASGD